MDERNGSIEERLERLERKCRRLRIWCVGVTGVLAVACAAAAVSPSADVIRAKRFEAVDDEGRTAAVLAGSFGDYATGGGLLVGEYKSDCFATLQIHELREEESGRAHEAIMFQMRVKDAESSSHFEAAVWPGFVLNEVANHRRAIISYVEPEESSFRVESRCQADCEPDCELDCGRTLLEVLAQDEDLRMVALDENAEVLFELP